MKLKKKRNSTSPSSKAALPGATLAAFTTDLVAHIRMVQQGHSLALAVHELANRGGLYEELVPDLEKVLTEFKAKGDGG